MNQVLLIYVWASNIFFFLSLKCATGQRETDSHNLNFLMNVLEQRGLLGRVDPSLLNRLRNVAQHQQDQTDLLTQFTVQRSNFPAQPRPGKTPNKAVSILDRAKSRAQNSKFKLAGESFQSSQRVSNLKNHKIGDECQALKTENRLLKQILSELTSDSQKIHPLTSLDIFGKNKVSPRKSDVLKELLHSTKAKETNVETKPILNLLNQAKLDPAPDIYQISPTPLIETTITTTSYETTHIFNKTEEIPILFRGRTILSTVIEPTSEVMTKTEVFTTTIQVSPTQDPLPVVSAITAPLPLQTNLQNLLEQARKRALLTQTPVKKDTARLDNFQSFQNLLNKLQRKTIPVSQETIPEIESPQQNAVVEKVPQTTIITKYVSGSVPGEYSTQLQTIVTERKKRDTLSQNNIIISSQLIRPTRVRIF